MSYCCIFAGQGAQVPGMGKDFAEADADAMSLFDKANAVLGFDLKKICFEGPAEELTKSNVCQPAIFVTSYAAYLALKKKKNVDFACAAGLSLGEWGALCAAGVLDFDSTLKVLEARGRFMQEACAAEPSGMIAIVGATPDQLAALCERTGNFGAANVTVSRTGASFSRAGAMNGEWKPPAVASGIARRMPSSFATAAADAIASFEPERTCCAAELTFATVQPVASQSAPSCSGVAPMTAIMPDGVAAQASCMTRPRASSTVRVESKSRTPAAHRAPHSPSERPAAHANDTLLRFKSAV